MTYESLLKSTAASYAVSEPPPLSSLRVDEIQVQSLWFAGHFQDHFQSTCGREITIISAGEWNRGAGPDFIQASIEIDGTPHHGPIEIDMESRNWERHGHALNENFDQVILHVVLEDDGAEFFTRTSQHRNVPRVVIDRDQLRAALGLPRLSQALARPGRCLQPLSHLPPEAVLNLLEQAARHRCRLKAQRFHRIATRHGFSQALWESFADTLGFAANRLPMRLLAQRLPIKVLRQMDFASSEAILFGTAGFLSPKLHETAPADSRQWLEDLWDSWWKHRLKFEFPNERSPGWNMTGSRPGNHPQRRLAALAAAIPHWQNLTKDARESAPFKKLSQTLIALSHPFWDRHHTLHSKKTEQSIRLLGPARLQEFLINTLFPVTITDTPSAWSDFTKIRGGPPNQKVTRCCERLFGSLSAAKPFLKYAWQHQALLQIYQDFCLEDVSDCKKCPFPEQLVLSSQES